MIEVRSIDWIPETSSGATPGHVRILDQTRLPDSEVYIETTDLATIDEAIRQLRVWGAQQSGLRQPWA